MADQVPRYELGVFKDDPKHFVSSVLGLPGAKALKPGAAVPPEWRVEAILVTEDGVEHAVVVEAGRQMVSERAPDEVAAARREAEEALRILQEELALCDRELEIADEAIETAHGKIREGEYELGEAKDRIRSLRQRREDARHRYWLDMENISAFGERRPKRAGG